MTFLEPPDALEGVDPTRKVIYFYIRTGGPLTPTELETYTGYSLDTIRRSLTELEKLGLVIHEDDAGDRRKRLYYPA